MRMRPPPASPDELLQRIGELNIYSRGERRAPHKPLLLLFVLGRMQAGHGSTVPAKETWAEIGKLLERHAPPVKSAHQPELPYWHLQSDGLWTVKGATDLPLSKGGFPAKGPLGETEGRLPAAVEQMLVADPRLLEDCAKVLLDRHFPETLHASLSASVGLVLGDPGETSRLGRRKRDPRFKSHVLEAYEHRCALTGFRAALDGRFFGVEAAHVRAHCYDGPDEVANGLVLTPTLHSLLDFGAWTLTDDRRVLVSRKFTGTDEAVSLLRDLHGSRVRDPLPGFEPVRPEYIRWHRDSGLGGVFRQPALPL